MQPILLALALACSPDSDGDSGPGAGATEPFTVRVEAGWRFDDTVPLPGVTIAVDDGAGGRTEATSGADGQATFQVDWSLGPIDLTIDQQTWVRTLSGVEEADGDLLLYVQVEDNAPETVITWGDVTGRTEDTMLEVAAYGTTERVHAPEASTYYLDVVAGEPLLLLAVESWEMQNAGPELWNPVSVWKLATTDAPTELTRFDLDLSEPTESVVEAGAVALTPDSALDLDGVIAFAWVDSSAQFYGQPHGFTTWSDRTPDGFEFTVEYVLLPDHPQRWTKVQIYTTSGETGSLWREPGTPGEWGGPLQVLPVPVLETPAEDWRSTRRLAMEPQADVAAQRCAQLYAADGQVLWLSCSLRDDEIRLPAPPSSMGADLLEQAASANPFYLATQGLDLTSGELQGWSFGKARALP